MGNFLKDFSLGIRTTFSGFGFAFRNKMGHYFLYPFLMTVVLAVVAVKAIRSGVDYLHNWLMDLMGIEPVEQQVEGWWDTAVYWFQNIAEGLITVLLYIAFYFLLHKTIKYVVLILMSPVMALISEKTEEVLTGHEFPFDFVQFAKDVWRGILIAIRNFLLETFLVLMIIVADLVITSIIPPLTIITTPVAFILSALVSSYYWGFATMDYTNERRRLTVSNSVKFIRMNKGVAVGNGLLFYVLISIPVIGPYIGPVFATVMCTVGATLAIHEKVDLNREDNYLVAESEKGNELEKTSES